MSGRRVLFSAIASAFLLAGCTLIDLSGLQGSGGGHATGASSSLSGASNSGSSASSGGAGGGGPVIHKLYVVGGREVAATPQTTIFTATIEPDGTIDPFDPVVQALSDPRQGFGLAVIDKHMFVIGGLSLDASNSVTRDTTLVSSMGTDGTLGGWATAAALLPMGALQTFATASTGEQIFIAGGAGDSANSDAILRADVVAGTIQSFAGPLGNLTMPASDNQMVIRDGVLVEMGGGALPKQVLVAPLNADGTLAAALSAGPSFNLGREQSCSASAVIGGATRIYVAGGDGSPKLDSIEVATLTNGILGTWTVSPIKLPTPRFASACFVLGDSFYVVGGVLTSDVSTNEIVRFSLDPTTGNVTAANGERTLPFPRGFHQVAVIDLPAP